MRGKGFGRFELAGRAEQHRLVGQQALPVFVFGLPAEQIDVLQASGILLAFHHAIYFFQFGEKVGAAKLDFFAGCAGTLRICVESHGS